MSYDEGLTEVMKMLSVIQTQHIQVILENEPKWIWWGLKDEDLY